MSIASVSSRGLTASGLLFATLGAGTWAWLAVAADPPTPPAPKTTGRAGGDTELVRRVIATRKDYQQSLVALYEHYSTSGDAERSRWVADELKAYYLGYKPSYRLDIQDVPPASLEARTNIKEANDLFKLATDYRTKRDGLPGSEAHILNQRRSELLLQEILHKYPDSDKIADVAYDLGELYESSAYKQYDRAAAYYERSSQWRKGGVTDARLRAARLYDRMLNERSKALDLYREVISHDTDPERIKSAERRLAELTNAPLRR